MGYPSYVQGGFGFGTGGGVSATVTLGSNTTLGNTLIFLGFAEPDASDIYPNPGAGWTLIGETSEYTNTPNYYQVAAVYAQTVATSTNSYTFTAPAYDLAGYPVILLEFSPLDVASIGFDTGNVPYPDYTSDAMVVGSYYSVPSDEIILAFNAGLPTLGTAIVDDNTHGAGFDYVQAYDATGTYYGALSAYVIEEPIPTYNYGFEWLWSAANPSNQLCLFAFLSLPAVAGPGAPVLSNTPGNAQNALTWTTPSGSPTSYSLLRGTSSGGESATPIYTGSTASYTDTGLTNGTAYYYEVYATNAGGNGADSNEVAGTPFTVPSAPVLSGTAGLGMNTLSWTTPNNRGATITDYSVLRGTSSGGESGTPLYTDLVNGYIDAAVTPGTEYYYEVYATNVAGNSSDSNEVGLVPTAALSGLPLAPPAVAQADQNRTRVLITTGYPIAWGPESFGRGRSGK